MDMLGIPLTHFRVAPSPLKCVSVEPIVLWPCNVDVLDERLARRPGLSLQVSMTECAVEQLRLVQP